MEKGKKSIIAGAGILIGCGIAAVLWRRQSEAPPGEGRIWGYVKDSLTGERISGAKVYIDDLQFTSGINGQYITDYYLFGEHCLVAEADNYEPFTTTIVIEKESAKAEIRLDPLTQAPTQWTEGVVVREIKIEPTIAYIGETVNIKVYVEYPWPEFEGAHIDGEILIDGLSFKGAIDAPETIMRFEYQAINVGSYTIRAQDKSAHFQVLQDIAGTYYMPWGGVRMPVCTEWVNEECVAWNPVDATVSTYVVRGGWWSGQLVAMAVDYSCKEYWNTKAELVSMIASTLGYNSVPPLAEWILEYGTTCPVCNGTGQVICTREMRHCLTGQMTECRNCKGTGKVLLVDLERGWRDWQKEIEYHSVCGAGSCTPSIRCPYCDQKIYGPSHTRGLSWDKESFVRQVLSHIEERHPSHPLTEPAWF